jgi:RecA-family ATPase
MNPNNQNEIPVIEPVKKPMNFYKHLRITADKPEVIPDAVVKIHGIPVCTRKNLTLLSGASKSGKTAITSVICAGAISFSGLDGSAAIEVSPNVDSLAIIHIDTEQSRYHHYRNFKYAVLKRAGLATDPAYYYSYNLRQLPQAEYERFLDSLFETAHEINGGIHLAVIDGVADFIPSVNDEVEANRLTNYLEQLAIKYDTTIILVLHVNPGSEKERGHLGSHLLRKCESVLTIKKEGDISALEAKLLRGGAVSQFTPVYYQFDDYKGYHVFMDAGDSVARKRALRELAEKVFTNALTSVKALKKIEELEKCVERTAKRRLKDMLEVGVIERQELDNGVYYQLPQSPVDDKTPF